MKMTNEQIAMVCHQVNKAYCTALGDLSQAEWELAPEWQRESAIAGVQAHIDSGFTMLPEDSHRAWAEQKIKEGWTYGLAKDPIKKTHPCLVPYAALPVEQRVKDYLFREVVHCLGQL